LMVAAARIRDARRGRTGYPELAVLSVS